MLLLSFGLWHLTFLNFHVEISAFGLFGVGLLAVVFWRWSSRVGFWLWAALGFSRWLGCSVALLVLGFRQALGFWLWVFWAEVQKADDILIDVYVVQLFHIDVYVVHLCFSFVFPMFLSASTLEG